MSRAILIALLGLLLTSCASTRVGTIARVSVEPRLSSELECVADCLDDAEETCESCVAHCLGGDGPQVAVLR